MAGDHTMYKGLVLIPSSNSVIPAVTHEPLQLAAGQRETLNWLRFLEGGRGKGLRLR